MRKLTYSLNLKHLHHIKEQIVPILFTAHQFTLIEKRFMNKKMTPSEKNEFSRTISRKMNAIYRLVEQDADHIFTYGKEKIRPERLPKARRHLHHFSRKFRNKHIFIAGSFLYKEKYNDIDIFVISKYDKEDYQDGKFHINYLPEDIYYSLFFGSIAKLCISNRKMERLEIKDKINEDTFVSLYQELYNDIDNKFVGVKKILREFLLQAAYLSKSPLPASDELQKQIDAILDFKDPGHLIQKIFVQAMSLGIPPQKALPEMKEMIAAYKEIIKEYPQHKEHYLDLINGFQEVITLAS